MGVNRGFTIPLIDLARETHRQVVVDREPGQYLGHPTTVLLEDGRTMIAVYPKGHGKGAIVMKRSADGGLTWSEPVAVTSHALAHLCEPGAVRSPDGKQLAVLLRENSRKFNAMVVFSDDEGESWTAPRELHGALTGDRHKCCYSPDGRLVVTFRDTCLDTPTWGDWCAWVGTYENIVDGEEGQYRVRLMDNTKGGDCAYPGMELLPDGTIVATTYGHWEEGAEPFVVSVRFRLADLDAMEAN